MKRILLCLSATLLVSIAAAPPASASHVNCGDVVTQDTTLDSDLLDCPGDGLVIGADGVTVDLVGHTIDGTGANDGGQGVDNDEGHDGVTIRRGRIQEFQAGVYFDHGSGGTLRGLTLIDSGASFQAFDSDFNTFQRNDISSGLALYGDSDGNTIDLNRSDAGGTPVFIFGFAGAYADGNKVTRNRLTGIGDESYGVYVSNTVNTLIEANQIHGHAGIGIAVNGDGFGSRIERNTLSENGEGIALDGSILDTLVLRNTVRHSAGDGIRLGSATRGTVVERNTANRNGDDGLDSDAASANITQNTANYNGDLGIEAVPGVTDGGGNKAKGNGNAAQCVGVSCS